jgi:hypothetical protein
MTTMLFSFTSSPVLARNGGEGARICSAPRRRTTLHPAPRDDDRHVTRVCRRDAIAVRAAAVRLPRIEQHTHRHRIDDRRVATNLIPVGNSLTSYQRFRSCSRRRGTPVARGLKPQSSRQTWSSSCNPADGFDQNVIAGPKRDPVADFGDERFILGKTRSGIPRRTPASTRRDAAAPVHGAEAKAIFSKLKPIGARSIALRTRAGITLSANVAPASVVPNVASTRSGSNGSHAANGECCVQDWLAHRSQLQQQSRRD